MAPLYVYGFAPRMTQEDFTKKLLEPFSEDYLEKVDFKGDKIYAFVHVKTLEQANEIINYWNGRKMDDGKHPLQVRHKGASNNQNKNGPGNQMNNHQNNQQQMYNQPPPQQQKPAEPVLYVYGFPKNLSEEMFRKEFLMQHADAVKKVDYFGDKLYAFVHCYSNQQCDELIAKWEGNMMNGSKRPLQVRYKGDASAQQIMNMPPVLWVYGFPPKTSEESFRNEFFLKFQNYVKKIDFYEKKLYCFVHCHTPRQCQDLINHWDGKMMQNSTQALQVRFKGNSNKQNNMGGQMNFGQNQFNQFNGYNNGQYFNNGMMMPKHPNQNQMMAPNGQYGMQFGMPMQNNQMQPPMHNNGNMQNYNQGMPPPNQGGWGQPNPNMQKLRTR